jgi:hypothetical protein
MGKQVIPRRMGTGDTKERKRRDQERGGKQVILRGESR